MYTCMLRNVCDSSGFRCFGQFVALLELLRSPDNAARSAAEQRYSACLAAEAKV